MASKTTEKQALTRHIGTVSGLTLVSRLSGLVRDMVFAGLFGAGFAADAFNIAFTIPNIFRRFLAEGAMSIAFVPVFTEYRTTHSFEENRRLYDVTLTTFTTILIFVTTAGIVFSPYILKLFAPGFGATKFALAVYLNRLLFPYLFFVGLTALFTGILNTHRHFAAPAAAPILLNAAIIGCALTLSGMVSPPITAMAIGVLAGGLLGLLLQVPFLLRRGIRPRPRIEFGHPAVAKMMRLMGPALFGVAVYQVNILVSRALASLLPEGSVTYIYYSDRFLELPLGVFAVAVATVALPSLSEHASAERLDRLKETLGFALRLTLLVCIPAMVWMAICRRPIIATLLERGRFGMSDTLATAHVFLFASLGIWAIAGIRNLVPAFYSLKDTRTPVAIAFAAFLLNAGLGVLLMWPMGPAGLTLANSISATMDCLLLVYFLRRKIGPLGLRAVWGSAWRVALASLGAGVAAWPFTRLDVWTVGGTAARVCYLALAGLAGALTFLMMARILRVPEMESIRRRIVGRKRR